MNGIVSGFRYGPGWCGSAGITDAGDPPEAADECEAGGDHEMVSGRERYGDDADGNRGIWIEVEYCRKCKQESGEL